MGPADLPAAACLRAPPRGAGDLAREPPARPSQCVSHLAPHAARPHHARPCYRTCLLVLARHCPRPPRISEGRPFLFFWSSLSQSTCSTAALPWRASRAIGPGAPASGVGADAVDTRPPLLGQLVAAWAAERVSDGHTTSTRRVVSLATLHRESPPICRCRASRVANAPAPLLAFPPPSPRSARSSRRLPLPSVGPLPIFGESADDVPYEFCFTEI